VNQLPIVSIVIPVYNTGLTLDETIRSVQKQTYKNIEVIIVNDGSTDEFTIKSLNKYKDSFAIINQENKGLPAARNAGIKASNGEYVVCLDSDDCIDKNYIKKLVNKLISDGDDSVAIVSPYIQAFGVSSEQWYVPEFDKEKIKYSNVVAVASMFKKAAWKSVGGYDESFRKGFEDWEFWLSLVENGYKWRVVKEPIFYYRRKKSSMITDSNKSRNEINANIYNKHRFLYNGETLDDVLKKMRQAEIEKNNPQVSVGKYLKIIFNKNFLKRFKIFR
jgi:glycosyltransferase involved in cell wall biosynthesis